MRKISFLKVALTTMISIMVFLSFCYFSSLQYLGPKVFLNNVFGEHNFIYPDEIPYNLLVDAYHHNEDAARWRISEYGIDDNGWKLFFPAYLEGQIPEEVTLVGDEVNDGCILEPQ